MIADIIKGVFKYLEALSYISKLRLGKYFLYSGLIGIVVLSIAAIGVYYTYPIISTLLEGIVSLNITWFSSITDVVSVIGGSVFFLIIFKYLMLIFTAPLMSRLSEEIEIYIDGDNGRQVSIYNTIKEIIRGGRIAVRNIIREIIITIFLLILGLLPVIGVIAAPMIIISQAYFAGFGNIDFWAERHYDYRNTVKYMSDNKGVCIGNGLPYLFLLAIPVLGVFIAPPLATIAGTLHAHSKKE